MGKIAIKPPVWLRNPTGNNMVLENDKFVISYNPVAGAMINEPLGQIAQLMGGMINGEGQAQEETALYDHKTWRILVGDFRKQYEVAWPDWQKCLAVYNKYKEECRSGWSTD